MTRTHPSSEQSLTILVVDDERDSAGATAAVLTAMGHQVHTAYDGGEALAAFQQFRPRVVFMDLGMPVMSGWETAARIRMLKHGPAATIVALSGYGAERDRQHSREASIDHHLVKPAPIEAIEELLRNIAAREAVAGSRPFRGGSAPNPSA